MALIKCPECMAQISDNAQTCPQCGFPVHDYQKQQHAKGGQGASRIKKVNFNCPHCKSVLDIAPLAPGDEARCYKCGGSFVVPSHENVKTTGGQKKKAHDKLSLIIGIIIILDFIFSLLLAPLLTFINLLAVATCILFLFHHPTRQRIMTLLKMNPQKPQIIQVIFLCIFFIFCLVLSIGVWAGDTNKENAGKQKVATSDTKAEATQPAKEAREKEEKAKAAERAAKEPNVPPAPPANLPKKYTIANEEDISIKALTKPLSSYTSAEVSSLPTNVRKEYRILVPSDITPEDLKAAMIQLVQNESYKNPDIDEIVAFAYDRKQDIESIYTYGKIEWCPNGNWAGVTPEIARSNNRSTYKFNIDIKEKVGKQKDRPTEREMKIYDATHKALFDDPDKPEDAVMKSIARKYKISTDELDRIYLKVTAYKMN